MTKSEILEKMKIDLETEGKCQETVRNYCMHARLYQDYRDKPADEMGETEIAAYLHYLLTKKKLSHASVNVQNSSLRFLYGITLDRLINTRKLPRIKQVRSLPDTSLLGRGMLCPISGFRLCFFDMDCRIPAFMLQCRQSFPHSRTTAPPCKNPTVNIRIIVKTNSHPL
jgi:hypothetical protein